MYRHIMCTGLCAAALVLTSCFPFSSRSSDAAQPEPVVAAAPDQAPAAAPAPAVEVKKQPAAHAKASANVKGKKQSVKAGPPSEDRRASHGGRQDSGGFHRPSDAASTCPGHPQFPTWLLLPQGLFPASSLFCLERSLLSQIFPWPSEPWVPDQTSTLSCPSAPRPLSSVLWVTWSKSHSSVPYAGVRAHL